MAAANGNNTDLLNEELHLSLKRLGIAPNHPGVPLFRQFASPGRGLGLKSIGLIPRGTPILLEMPLFFVEDGMNLTPAQENDPSFLGLSCTFQPGTPKPRFDANNFEMGNGRKGIFIEASRFNHSCKPNAYFAWNWRARRLTVHAIIDIPADTEIFVNYRAKDYSKTILQRRQKLRNKYNFDCTCEACQSITGFDTASEDRRKQMRLLNRRIGRNEDAGEPALRTQLLADTKSLIFLLQQEGLFYPQLADAYDNEVKWYIDEMESATIEAQDPEFEAKCLDDALKAARQKLDLDVACNGHKAPEVTKTLKFIVRLREKYGS